MKPIVNIDFSGKVPLDECAKYFEEVVSALKNKYYVIGTYKPYMEIKEMFGDSMVLKFNDKDYTVAEIIKALEEYEKGGDNKCQI